jgi:hypothetical protein
MSQAYRKGYTRYSAQVARAVQERDGHRCMLALPGEWTTRTGQVRRCLGRSDCAHHTRGRQVTGDDPLYMVAACTPCNLRVGQPSTLPDPAPMPRTQW